MRFIALALLGLVLCHVAPAAADDYPDHVVKIIVPSGAGGGFDTTARVVADKLGAALGQTVVIENRTGAGTLVGTDAVAKLPADGYTLLLGGLSNMALNPGLYKKLPYDPLEDFVPVSMIVKWSFTLLARKDLPQNTLQEVIAYAKAHPGELTYASAGSGTGQHVAMAVMTSLAGVKLTHVPFRGSAAAYQDLLGGRLDLFFDNTSSALPHVQAKALKVLAVSSAERQAIHPEVPTVMETGVAPLDMETWFGLFVRRGTPEPILEKLRAAMAAVLADARIRQVFEKTGGNMMDLSVAETEAMVKHDAVRWTKLLQDAGVTVE